MFFSIKHCEAVSISNDLDVEKLYSGYMAPEYAMEGMFSEKSDVYSFGVLILEIVSGSKNVSFRGSEHRSLIGYVSFS